MKQPTAADARDMVAGKLKPLLFWGLPSAALILASGFNVAFVVWPPALLWMGVACAVNAARCGRVHCYFTGPFFLVMAVFAALHGWEIVPLGAAGWRWLGAITLTGGLTLAYLPELVLGKYARRA